MQQYHCHVEKCFPHSTPAGRASREIIQMFGIDTQCLGKQRLTHSVDFRIQTGQICFITGPSGAGKSVLLNALFDHMKLFKRKRLGEIALNPCLPLIDTFDKPTPRAMSALCRAGLSDPFCAIQKVQVLSEGQRYRARLAHLLMDPAEIVFADEFCSSLDRITALNTAHQVRRLADEQRKVFILASSHDDLIAELCPEVLVIKQENLPGKVIYKPCGL